MNPEYEELIALGAPRLPKGFSVKFNINKKRGTFHYEKREYLSLVCTLRKHFLGIPFSVETWFMTRDNAESYIADDNAKLIRNGSISPEDLGDGYIPHHFAVLVRDSWDGYKRTLEKKKQNPVADITKNVNRFLGKGMP
jgi:hypothetical protein